MTLTGNENMEQLRELLFRDTTPFDLAKEMAYIYNNLVQYILNDDDTCGASRFENSLYYLRLLICSLLSTSKDNNQKDVDYTQLFSF